MQRLLKDRRGIAAVEFALVTSLVLLPLFLGLIEVISLYRVQAKVTTIAGYVAEMVAMENPSGASSGVYSVAATGTSATTLQDICQGAIQSMAPFPTSGMTIYIASVTEESGPAGLPTTNTSIYTTSPTYDEWEEDFTVSSGSCTGGSTTAIGASSAESLATSDSTDISGSSSSAMINVPCDNVIIVKVADSYPGLIGLILKSRPTLKATAMARWNYDSIVTELKASGAQTSYATTQVCNSDNSGTN